MALAKCKALAQLAVKGLMIVSVYFNPFSPVLFDVYVRQCTIRTDIQYIYIYVLTPLVQVKLLYKALL